MRERTAPESNRLSGDLLALKVWFDQCLSEGTEMTLEGSREFSRLLGRSITRATALEDGIALAADVVEAMTILEPAPPAPDNVVAFRPRALVRRRSNDGDAA